MGIGEERLTEAFVKSFGSKSDVIEQMPAFLGAYINGQKTFVVNGQPDYVWVRVRGQTADRVKAFNQHAGGVAHHWNLPIIIAKIPTAPDIWTVIGRDIRRYESWAPTSETPYSSPYLVKHGGDHSFTSQQGMGADPVWVFKRQMMPLLPHPAPTGTMSIELGSDFYYYNGQYNWFASTGTADFTSFLPTGAMNGKFVTVYIEGDTGNPAYLDGGEINALIPPIDAADYIAVPTPAQGIPVAAVFLLTGTSRIGWGEIFDLRHPHVPVPATGSFLSVYDEGSFIGSSSEIDFVGAGVSAAFAAQRTTVTVPGGLPAGSTRFAVGQPSSLGNGVTGTYWRVPDSEYYTGSLAVALGGVVQTPGIDYAEQHPGSGTYEFLTERPPTGSVQTVWYGVGV